MCTKEVALGKCLFADYLLCTGQGKVGSVVSIVDRLVCCCKREGLSAGPRFVPCPGRV